MPEQELGVFKNLKSMFSPYKGMGGYRHFDLHMTEGGFFASLNNETSKGNYNWVKGISAPYADVQSFRFKEFGMGYIALLKFKTGKHFWQFRRIPIQFTKEQVGELRQLIPTIHVLSEKVEFQY